MRTEQPASDSYLYVYVPDTVLSARHVSNHGIHATTLATTKRPPFLRCGDGGTEGSSNGAQEALH